MVPNEAIKRYRELPPNARLLYDCLCMYRNHRTGKCFPSIESLMSDSGLSRSAIYQARQTLQAAGWAEFDGIQATLRVGFKVNGVDKQESENPGIPESENPGQQNPGIPESRNLRIPDNKIPESRTKPSEKPGLTCKEEHRSEHGNLTEEAEGSGADDSLPFENFTDPQTEMAEAVSIAIGIPSLPEGEDARSIHDAAAEFINAGVTPADVRAYEQDYYRRKAAQGSAYPLTLKILREDIRGWARSRRMLEAAKSESHAAEDPPPNRPPLIVAPPEWRRKPQNGGAR